MSELNNANVPTSCNIMLIGDIFHIHPQIIVGGFVIIIGDFVIIIGGFVILMGGVVISGGFVVIIRAL